MPVVGTAGHVDHGKSTLVMALTGRDPDRWAEEKERGLTIDLGFAWADLGTGELVGFVDVPGHERFIKNMLAGVDAIDAVLFVVAADEGWMPQSEEHLAILDQLGVHAGVLALTRADLVDAETLELAELEVRDHLDGTSLEDLPVVGVAAPMGIGLDQVRDHLRRAVLGSEPPLDGRPRMWVDRSFSIGGAGTVVTGTLLGGEITTGDALTVWPGGLSARVRGIQSHDRAVDVAYPGTRTALNLAGVDRAAIERGAMVGRPEDWRLSQRFLADVRTVRRLAEPVRDRGAWQLHVGSGAWPARMRLLEAPTLEGRGAALITPSQSLPLRVGDRFILRDVGRRAVVAGGVVLDPAPPARKPGGHVELLRRAVTADDFADALLEARSIASLSDLAAQSGGGRPRSPLVAGALVMAESHRARLTERAERVLQSFHQQSPLRPGMPSPTLAESLGIPLDMLAVLVAATPSVVVSGAAIRHASFDPGLDAAAEERWRTLAGHLADAGLTPPRLKELGVNDEVLHAYLRLERLIKVSDDFVYLPSTLDGLVGELVELPDPFSVAEFRDQFEITRKHAVPLLEWLDRTGVTARAGDVRTLRR